jgi:hypothetical protein
MADERGDRVFKIASVEIIEDRAAAAGRAALCELD